MTNTNMMVSSLPVEDNVCCSTVVSKVVSEVLNGLYPSEIMIKITWTEPYTVTIEE